MIGYFRDFDGRTYEKFYWKNRVHTAHILFTYLWIPSHDSTKTYKGKISSMEDSLRLLNATYIQVCKELCSL